MPKRRTKKVYKAIHGRRGAKKRMAEAATDKQKAELARLGMPPRRMDGMSAGEASDSINKLRKKRGEI